MSDIAPRQPDLEQFTSRHGARIAIRHLLPFPVYIDRARGTQPHGGDGEDERALLEALWRRVVDDGVAELGRYGNAVLVIDKLQRCSRIDTPSHRSPRTRHAFSRSRNEPSLAPR